MKKVKGKANKAGKKRTKNEVMKTVEELNRTESLVNVNEPEKAEQKLKEKKSAQEKEKPKRKSKYQIISEYIKQHNGQYSRSELITALSKDHQICAGTAGAFLADARNEKYKPVWLTENLMERNGKIFME